MQVIQHHMSTECKECNSHVYLTRNRSILVERTISLWGGGCLALSHWKRVSIEKWQIICLFVTSMSPSPPWCAVLQMMSGASLDELWQHKCCPQHLGCAETNKKLEVNASWNLGVIDHDTLDIIYVLLCLLPVCGDCF